MGMTTLGLARQLYSSYVEPRPFSRFTQDIDEIEANAEWAYKAIKWAKQYMNTNGGLNAEGVQRYILKTA